MGFLSFETGLLKELCTAVAGNTYQLRLAIIFICTGNRFRFAWEDGFSKGLYLAGVECVDNAEAPDGWTKWIIPSYEYIVVENHNGAFEDTIEQMNKEGISLVGAVHDYTDPATGKEYMYFPIREI